MVKSISKDYPLKYNAILMELNNLASCGKFTNETVEQKIDTAIIESEKEMQTLDEDIVYLKNYHHKLKIRNLIGMSLLFILQIIFIVLSAFPIQISFLSYLLVNVLSLVSYFGFSTLFSKTLRKGFYLEKHNITIDNLKSKEANISLYHKAYIKLRNKLNKRMLQRNLEEKKLPEMVTLNRKHAEAVMENYYNDEELQSLMLDLHQDIVNANTLEELKLKIKDIRLNLDKLKKDVTNKKKIKIAAHLEENAQDAEYLYAMAADEYEENRVRKLLED